MKKNEPDVAIKIVGDRAQPCAPEIERSVVRKTDLWLLPFMWLGYGLVYYDKAILGSAAVLGITSDLSLSVVVNEGPPIQVSTARLSWATSLFYFGMLAGLFPLTYLFQKFNLGRTVGSVITLWGITAMCTSAVTTYQGLYVQRFFLGFAESIVPTAFLVIISSHYTQAEQTWRQCIWYSSTGGWTVLGSLINYGFANVQGSLHKWSYLYLLAGSVTTLYGIAFFFFPNTPAEAFWLNKEERRVAIERLRSSQLGVRCQQIKWYQIREALTDVKVWMIAFMMGLAYIVNGAVSGFGPLIVSTFGWKSSQAILWQMPLGAVCFVTTLLVGWLSLVYPNTRLIMLSVCCLPVIAGCTMIWKNTWSYHGGPPIAGYTLIGFFAPITSLVVSMGMSNIAGASKKSFMSAAIFVFYCVGNIVGPILVQSETVQQHYPRLWTAIISCYCLLIIIAATLYVLLRAENRRRGSMDLDQTEGEKVAFRDLTDRENAHFRYVL